jgi:hypothetical protein
MWTACFIVFGIFVTGLFMVPFLWGFVTEFLKLRRQGRKPRLRIFDEK